MFVQQLDVQLQSAWPESWEKCLIPESCWKCKFSVDNYLPRHQRMAWWVASMLRYFEFDFGKDMGWQKASASCYTQTSWWTVGQLCCFSDCTWAPDHINLVTAVQIHTWFFLLFTPSFIALHCYLHQSLLIPIWDWHWCVPYVTRTVVSGCPNLAILKLKCLTSSFIVLHLVNESSDPGPGDQSMVINKARLAFTKWLRIMAMHSNLRSQKFIRAPGLFHQVVGLESIS